ncbi:hypothetical protein FHW88_000460 [Mucilaginibacter sp. SG538B]|uniref:hypothetical protein n=1 Tax=Mucilaginibacter sp. SG538B TaxID=2587021 RepID=UPI00159DFCC0|nr:hypothetical protein [Mucilaginibacter sp. SG538B]NVM62184.1 hypothetical protein [Mucilaginibacter sp. SG538B]
MKYIFSFLAVLLLQALPKTIHAQDPNGITLPKIIPPGPQSREFQRFLGYAANGSTGTMDISIPLYNLQLPGLSIPFGLRYNSSGVKVNQSWGIVGYGWFIVSGVQDQLYHYGQGRRTV